MYMLLYEVMVCGGFFVSENDSGTEVCSRIFLMYVVLDKVRACDGLFVNEDKR